VYLCARRPDRKRPLLPRRGWNWRLDRVYFLAFLNPSQGQPDPVLTARLASAGSVGPLGAGTRGIYRYAVLGTIRASQRGNARAVSGHEDLH
jgi:hypothetical protein